MRICLSTKGHDIVALLLCKSTKEMVNSLMASFRAYRNPSIGNSSKFFLFQLINLFSCTKTNSFN